MNARFQQIALRCALLTLFSLSLFPLSAHAVEYGYDQQKSRVTFEIRHLGILTVQGHFKTFSGSFLFDPRDIEASRVEIAIKTASVDSGLPHRDRDLCSKNFFWSEKHPDIRFKGEKVGAVQGPRFNILGELTIRGIARPVVFETELLREIKEGKDSGHLSFHAETFIRRKDFHLGTGHWFDPIMLVTDETLKISLEIEGIPAPPSSSPVLSPQSKGEART